MKVKSLFALAIALFFCQTGLAQADGPNGLYLGVKVGAGITHSDTVLNTQSAQIVGNWGPPAPGPFSIDMGSKFRANLLAGASVGYDFSKAYTIPIRLELDYAYRFGTRNDWRVSSLSILGQKLPVNGAFSSKISTQTLLFNLWYDIDTGTKLTPYVGGGVGVAFVTAKDTIAFRPPLNNLPIFPVNYSFSKTKTNFAWDLGLGLAYNVSENVALDLAYRFVYVGKVSPNQTLRLITTDPGNGGYVIPLAAENKAIYSHDITFGVRYTF
ncbi:MAG: outer membrane beta-barrel protein [Deltaproteobacteria bacterium]|jgi:opacity protein-like surface antigen|nr:outer membrane beta-barrel protein [Deltaproteobacteria bacterium]